MRYTKDQLLACLLYEFGCVDDLDLDIIEEILVKKGAFIEGSEAKIYQKNTGIKNRVVITAGNKSDGSLNCTYTLPREMSKVATVTPSGFDFLSESVDRRLYDAVKSIKINAMEWLLKRLLEDKNRASLTNSTLANQINAAIRMQYVESTKHEISSKAKGKIKDPNILEKTMKLISVSNSGSTDERVKAEIIRLTDLEYIIGSSFNVTEKGKLYIYSEDHITPAPDYLNHGTKEMNNSTEEKN